MKESLQHNQDEVAIVKQVQQKKKREHVGQIIPHEGHSIFEFNKVTYELRKAKFEYGSIMMTGNSKGVTTTRTGGKTVIVKENCYYLSSLNVKNAVKKIHRLLIAPCVIDMVNE
jgi:hypothetical protein